MCQKRVTKQLQRWKTNGKQSNMNMERCVIATRRHKVNSKRCKFPQRDETGLRGGNNVKSFENNTKRQKVTKKGENKLLQCN